MHRIKKAIARIAHIFVRTEMTSKGSTFDEDIKSTERSFEKWIEENRHCQCLYVDLNDQNVELLKERFKHQVEKNIADAECVMTHKFDLLGSGPYTPIDSHRRKGNDGYIPIDWYLDPVRKLSFPRGIPHKEWDLFKMRPENADIKLPWELARCQHFVTLGQAFRISNDSRYAIEMANQINDFMDANPVGVGINWTCTMDVAIRAANWAMGLALIKKCNNLSIDLWHRLYGYLFDCGDFIYHNFENNYEVTSNHYLSNIVGLYFLASVFNGLPSANKWQSYCRKSIIEEIDKQILEDGADFESSIPYHRLVLELFLAAARLAEIQEKQFPESYYRKLSGMAGFLFGVLRPDGLMPVVGDADDGRLHIFSNYGGWNRQEGMHVLAPAAIMLNRKKWLSQAGKDELWEAAWWGFDIDRMQFGKQKKLPDSVRHFPKAGITAARHGNNYLLISNSIVGTEGFGNHKHNDQLSFEFHCNRIPLIVDPGSYVYTSDFNKRNLFRSTGYHNTLRIDRQEQNEFNPEWLFRMFEKANAKHLSFEERDEYIEYIGLHSGYRRLEKPVTHSRCFRYIKKQHLLIILDILSGQGEHVLSWHFHFAPDLNLYREKDIVLMVKSNDDTFFLSYPQQLKLNIDKGFYSPSYGVKQKCACVDLTANEKFDHLYEAFFVIGAYNELISSGFSTLIDQHRSQMKNKLADKNEFTFQN